MLKKSMLCGAMALFLSAAPHALPAQAQGFILKSDSNNGSSATSRRGTTTRATPAYKGGVTVPFNPDERSKAAQRRYDNYNSYNRQRAVQRKTNSAPIPYGRSTSKTSGPGYLAGKNPEDMTPEEIRQMRKKEYQERRAAKNEKKRMQYEQRKHNEKMAESRKKVETMKSRGYLTE